MMKGKGKPASLGNSELAKVQKGGAVKNTFATSFGGKTSGLENAQKNVPSSSKLYQEKN